MSRNPANPVRYCEKCKRARCMAPHTMCSRCRPAKPSKPPTPEQRQKWVERNAKRRLRDRAIGVLGGFESW